MADPRRLLPAFAFAALAACAAHKTQPSTSPSSAPPAVAKTHGKAAHVEKNRASVAVGKNTALPAREVGYYLDVLQGRLQQRLDPAVIVGRDGDSIVLDFSRRLGFAARTAQLDDVDRGLLLPLAKVLDEYQAALVSVRVSAEDETPAGRKLARERGGAIARMLAENGVADARIVALVSDAATRDGEAHVEIVLAPETR